MNWTGSALTGRKERSKTELKAWYSISVQEQGQSSSIVHLLVKTAGKRIPPFSFAHNLMESFRGWPSSGRRESAKGVHPRWRGG